MNQQDPIVLSYHECLLRQSDVNLLNGPNWLNDNIISFYFEYLSEHHRNLLFVSPEVTQCIKIIPIAQIKVFLDPLKINKKNISFFALNDNDRPQTAGGSHWSLLVFSRNERLMYHYDSSKGSNEQQARYFADKIFAYFNIEGQFKEEPCVQQKNGYDCGIHLINNAQYLAKFIETANDLSVYYAKTIEVDNGAKNMRKQLMELIDTLKNR